jgi:hypothetical protein
LIEVAKAGGYAGVYVPTESNTLSNRMDIARIAAKKYVANKKEITRVEWDTILGSHPFSEVYEIWKAPEQAGGKAAERDGGEALPDNDLGGVDFRQLPVNGQPVIAPVLMPQLQQLASNSKIKDLDQEWDQIRGEMLAPEMPYNRIKEYIAVCLSRPDCRKKLDQAVCCIIDILRMEEDQALATNQELKDILMYLS